MQPLEKKSQSPLYQQLMMRLKNDILSGAYPPGGRIPSEQWLCDTYGVSRVTVRKALLDLVQEGLLVRRQGKGTFVADERIQRDLAHITSFSDACRQMGHAAADRIEIRLVRQAQLLADEPGQILPNGRGAGKARALDAGGVEEVFGAFLQHKVLPGLVGP